MGLTPARTSYETFDIVMIPPQTKPIYFIVKSMRYEGGDIDTPVDDHKQYYYEEHSCPTNWLQPEMMYFDGDSDPHGVIKYVATRDVSTFPPNEVWGPDPRDLAMTAFIEEHLVNE